jgi:glycosyltransferase involved in cell wall biosynthesis
MHIGQVNTNRDWGGGENQVFHLVQGLRDRNVQVTLFAHAEGELRRRAAAAGYAVCPVPVRGRLSVRALTRCVSERGVDLLHVHDSRAATLGAGVGRRLGLPVILSRRVSSPLRRNPLSRMKYTTRNFCAVIAISNTVRDVVLKTSRFPVDRVFVAPTGVDIGELDRVQPDPVLRRECGGQFLVGGVGKLSPKKNWPFLVRVAATLAADGMNIQWVIAGEGGERESIRALAGACGIADRIHLLGFRSDAPRILKSLDLLFFPSRMEGASVTVRECMVLGTPVVAVDAAGTMESLAGHGWGVRDGDVDGAARCVVEALTNQTLRRERIAAARRHAVANYPHSRTVSDTLAVYRTILAQRRSDLHPRKDCCP